MTFSITWTTESGLFGWTEISECIDMDDAIEHFANHVRGVDAPADAAIDVIKRV
jgi:hypothetical protein